MASLDPWAVDPTAQANKNQQSLQKASQLERQMEALQQQEAAARAAGKYEEASQIHGQLGNIQLERANAINATKGLSGDGSALAPEWKSLVDSSTGQLADQYKMNLTGLDPSQWAGYQQFQNEATRGPGQQSQWAMLQGQKQTAEEQQARDAAAKQAMTSQSQALSGLAMRGGVGSGARTRLALEGARGLQNAGQQVGQSGMMARLGIATTDEANRKADLNNLVNSQTDINKYNKTQEAQQQQFNLNNLAQEIGSRRQFDENRYNQEMKKWAGEKQAQATERASGGGGK